MPQAAVTPGQLAVLYQGDRVIGGATIERALGCDRGAGAEESAAAPAGSRSAAP